MKKIAIFILMGFSITSLTYAYSLIGLKWFSQATYRYNPAKGPSCCLTASQQESQVKAGRSPWGNITKFGSNTTLSGAKRDGANVASWAKLGGLTLGVTNFIDYDNNQTQDCNGGTFAKSLEIDVRFNNATPWQTSSSCTNGYDLQGVSTHEFGHVVGLGHTNVQGATMYPSVAACNFSLSSLANDDKSGLNAIYSGCN